MIKTLQYIYYSLLSLISNDTELLFAVVFSNRHVLHH